MTGFALTLIVLITMRLKQARTLAKLTQAQLADKAGVDQQTISKLENKRIQEPGYRTVVRICEALGVKPEQIDEFKA